MTKTKLAIFDIDGTLTEIEAELRAKNPKHTTPNKRGEQVPIAGVPEKLAQLQADGIMIALATNRGGVAWGYNTLAEAHDLALEAAELCGIPDVPIYVCPYHAKARGKRVNREYAREDECRKPNPGMLNMAMGMAKVIPAETIFVGDRDSDEEAAANAGVRFVWAEEFFVTSLQSPPYRK
ncbi:MAG: HAD-IIIA family hydrolase [Chloroflexota bacterium]